MQGERLTQLQSAIQVCRGKGRSRCHTRDLCAHVDQGSSAECCGSDAPDALAALRAHTAGCTSMYDAQEREADIEQCHQQQIETRAAALRQAQAAKLASIRASRVRTVRRLAHARRRAAAIAGSGVDSNLQALVPGSRAARPSVIERYLDYGSAGARIPVFAGKWVLPAPPS